MPSSSFHSCIITSLFTKLYVCRTVSSKIMYTTLRRKSIRWCTFNLLSKLFPKWKPMRRIFLSHRQSYFIILQGTFIVLIIMYLMDKKSQVNREYKEYVPRIYGYSHRIPRTINMTKLCERAKMNRYLKIDIPLTLCASYVLNNPDICRNSKHIFSLIIVNSAPDHFVHRQRMRLTVGNAELMPASVRIVFLLGTVSNATLQRQIVDEHNRYKDTVQGSFKDTYKNLTLKSVMGLKWITENCQNTEFVIRMDDDTSANMYYLLSTVLAQHIGRNKTLFCIESKYSMIIRDRDSKWFVDEQRFENMTNYPWVYCIGWAIVMSTDLIPHLYERAADVSTFWIDDIYVTGILTDMLKPVKFYDIQMDMGHDVKSLSHECFQKSRDEPCLFINSQDEFIHRAFWNFVHKDRYNFVSSAKNNLDLFEGF